MERDGILKIFIWYLIYFNLLDVPRVKAICYNYYIFIPSKGDKDSDCIHIVDCKDGCREVLIECDVNKDASMFIYI